MNHRRSSELGHLLLAPKTGSGDDISVCFFVGIVDCEFGAEATSGLMATFPSPNPMAHHA
jgi:hypothetical protein